jgi:polyhydroxyalkanoate synthesis regulator phasin
MAQDFESLLKDIFGESFNRFSKFEGEQTKRVMAKIHDIAREALKDELARLQTEINELRARVAVLEAERVQASSDQV